MLCEFRPFRSEVIIDISQQRKAKMVTRNDRDSMPYHIPCIDKPDRTKRCGVMLRRPYVALVMIRKPCRPSVLLPYGDTSEGRVDIGFEQSRHLLHLRRSGHDKTW